ERIPAGSLVVSVGDTELARQVIPETELAALGPEAFILRSGATAAGVPFIAADGNPGEGFGTGDVGDHYGSYAVLETLGYAFLHPLAPIVPTSLPAEAPTVDRTEKPRWRIRGLHIHTMHPLELTNVLQGWGESGPEDADSWRAMTGEWRSTCEWL